MTKRQIKKMYKDIYKKIESYYNIIKEDRERLNELNYELSFEGAMARNEMIEDINYCYEEINELSNDINWLRGQLY